MSPLVDALLVLAAYGLVCWGMWWDIGRAYDRAQHEVELDWLWGDDDGD